MKKNSTALSLLMILVLVLASTLLISFGASLTQEIQAQSDIELNDRSIRLYFNNRFKQNDILDSLSVKDSTLIFDLNGYYLLVYEENQSLMEQVSIDPVRYGNGEELAFVQDFKVEIDNQLVTITYINEANEVITLNYRVQAGESYE